MRRLTYGSVGRELRRKRDGGKPEQQTKQQPEICIQKEIFVGLNPAKRGGKEQEECVPENHEAQGKPWRTSEFFDHLPRGKHNRHAHDEPQDQSYDPHFNDECAVAAFHADHRRLHAKKARDILTAQRSCPDAIAVWPTVVAEGPHKVGQ